MKEKAALVLLIGLLIPWYVRQSQDPNYVVLLLISLLIASLLFATERTALRVALLATGFAFYVFFPSGLSLSPMIAYSALRHNDDVPGISFSVGVFALGLYHLSFEHAYLLLVMLLLVFAVRIALIKQAADTAKYHSLYNEMQETQLSLTQTLRSLVDSKEKEVRLAQLTERNRIMRDMHDGIGHMLSRTILQVGALQATSDGATKEALTSVQKALQDAMQQLRNLIHDQKADDFELRPALEDTISKFTFCPIELTYTIHSKLNLNASYSILAIVQEALNNIIRHSDADRVQVKCLETKDRIFINVKDNGHNAKVESFGMGLGSIRERAEALHGAAEFTDNDGFLVFVTLPKETTHATLTH